MSGSGSGGGIGTGAVGQVQAQNGPILPSVSNSLLVRRPADIPDEQLDVMWRDGHVLVSALTKGLGERDSHTVLQEKASESTERHNAIVVGIMNAILGEPSNATGWFKTLHFVVRDGFSIVIQQLQILVMEKYSKLHDIPRTQLLWLVGELVRHGVPEVGSICLGLLRQVVGGDLSPKNIWLITSILRILTDNLDWYFREQSPAFLIIASFSTFIRTIQDHSKPAFLNLRKDEIAFCVRVWKQRAADLLTIGRDLVRSLNEVCKLPEIAEIWKQLIGNPTSISPRFSGVRQLMATPTPRWILKSRITPDMETKLVFLMTHVRMGQQKRHCSWFSQRYLSTTESDTLIPDLIRWICGAHHPPNKILGSDVVQRWAVISWLLRAIRQGNLAIHASAKLALFYDWLMFDPAVDSIMNIEPAILLMVRSIPRGMTFTNTLLEFIILLRDLYYPLLSEDFRQGVMRSFQTSLKFKVVPSLVQLFTCNLLDPPVLHRAKAAFQDLIDAENASLQQAAAAHAAATAAHVAQNVAATAAAGSSPSTPTSSSPSSPATTAAAAAGAGAAGAGVAGAAGAGATPPLTPGSQQASSGTGSPQIAVAVAQNNNSPPGAYAGGMPNSPGGQAAAAPKSPSTVGAAVANNSNGQPALKGSTNGNAARGNNNASPFGGSSAMTIDSSAASPPSVPTAGELTELVTELLKREGFGDMLQKLSVQLAASNSEAAHDTLKRLVKKVPEAAKPDVLADLAAYLSVGLRHELDAGADAWIFSESKAGHHVLFEEAGRAPVMTLLVSLYDKHPSIGFRFLAFVVRDSVTEEDNSPVFPNVQPFTAFLNALKAAEEERAGAADSPVPDVKALLARQLEIAFIEDIDLFHQLTESCLLHLDRLTVGHPEIISLSTSCMKPHQLLRTSTLIARGKLKIVGESDLVELVQSSLSWDHFQQTNLWNLISSELGVIEPELLARIFSVLEPREHASAVMGLFQLLKGLPIISDTVEQVLTLSRPYNDFTGGLLVFWANAYNVEAISEEINEAFRQLKKKNNADMCNTAIDHIIRWAQTASLEPGLLETIVPVISSVSTTKAYKQRAEELSLLMRSYKRDKRRPSITDESEAPGRTVGSKRRRVADD